MGSTGEGCESLSVVGGGGGGAGWWRQWGSSPRVKDGGQECGNLVIREGRMEWDPENKGRSGNLTIRGSGNQRIIWRGSEYLRIRGKREAT